MTTIPMIKRHKVKSCCGHETLIFEPEKPIRKFQIDVFKKAGYNVPPNFFKHGIFYVTNNRLVATGPYGSTRINVKCYGNDCAKLLHDFEKLLLEATSIKKARA